MHLYKYFNVSLIANFLHIFTRLFVNKFMKGRRLAQTSRLVNNMCR